MILFTHLCTYLLTLYGIASVKVSLEILDVNDNAPEFPTSSLVRELMESSPVGTALTVDSATDRDTTQFGVERYQLVPDDEPAAAHFQLKVCCHFKFMTYFFSLSLQ